MGDLIQKKWSTIRAEQAGARQLTTPLTSLEISTTNQIQVTTPVTLTLPGLPTTTEDFWGHPMGLWDNSTAAPTDCTRGTMDASGTRAEGCTTRTRRDTTPSSHSRDSTDTTASMATMEDIYNDLDAEASSNHAKRTFHYYLLTH